MDVKPRQGIVEVEVTRGGRWESVHAVAWALAAADDRPADGTVAGLPDVFPRSAVKPLQALPVIETGAADSFGVSAAELALAAASHSGEPDHVAGVRGILAKAGCTVADLACGTHAPFAAAAAADLVRRGLEPSAIEHNCSGQHAAFLLVARHLGAAPGGYTAADHPVQRLVTEVLADLAGLPLGTDRFGIDGCGIPTFAIPLDRLAVAWARFAAPDSVAVVRREAARRVLAAMVAHPRLVAGSDRFDTLVMESIHGPSSRPGRKGCHARPCPAQVSGSRSRPSTARAEPPRSSWRRCSAGTCQSYLPPPPRGFPSGHATPVKPPRKNPPWRRIRTTRTTRNQRASVPSAG